MFSPGVRRSARYLSLAVLVLLSPVRSRMQEALPTGRDIVSRHVAALGGAAAFKSVRSVHARGRFEVRDRGLTGEFELFTARPNRMLYRVTLPGIGVIENGFDGKVAWTLSPISGPELLEGRPLDEAAEDAWFDAPLYEPDRVRSLEAVERTEFDGRSAFKVRVVLKSALERVEYFDVATGLQIGSESTRATPQGLVPTTNILRDYRLFGDVKQATTFVQRALGFEQVVSLTSVEYGLVPDSTFALPAPVAALVPR